MRVLVCGGRNYDDYRSVAAALSMVKITVLMQGGASGADALARQYASDFDIPLITFPANWSLGPKAGPLRNAFMLVEGKPDLVVAFPGGAGTADMVRRAHAAGVPIQRSQEAKEGKS